MKKMCILMVLLCGASLVMGASTVVEKKNGTVTTTPNGMLDLILHNGSVHVNGNVYKHIVLSGKLTNWTGYTMEDWRGTWGFVSLLGSDYFINRNVPAEVDETMSIFSYAGDSNYGDGGKQRGYAANGGLLFWKNGYWAALDQVNDSFAAEDSSNTGHKAEMGRNLLANTTQFEFEIVYDLEAMTMTAKFKDVDGAEWISTGTVILGQRHIVGSDDWSDVVMSMQMANNLEASSTSYGFVYTMQMAIVDVIPGDANCDGVVNVGDLGILAANYSGSGGKGWAQGDFNGDEVVNVGDLGILAANYGSSVSGASDFASDYAKVFGTAAEEDQADDENLNGTLCSTLGLSLVAGLALMGLMLVKLEE